MKPSIQNHLVLRYRSHRHSAQVFPYRQGELGRTRRKIHMLSNAVIYGMPLDGRARPLVFTQRNVLLTAALECLQDIRCEIVNVFQTHTEANKPVRYAARFTNLFRNACMGHGGWMAAQRLYASKALG